MKLSLSTPNLFRRMYSSSALSSFQTSFVSNPCRPIAAANSSDRHHFPFFAHAMHAPKSYKKPISP